MYRGDWKRGTLKRTVCAVVHSKHGCFSAVLSSGTEIEFVRVKGNGHHYEVNVLSGAYRGCSIYFEQWQKTQYIQV